MQDRDTNGNDPTMNASHPDNGPVTPADLMIAKFKKWLDDLETKLDQADRPAEVSSDIPRFYTRYR